MRSDRRIGINNSRETKNKSGHVTSSRPFVMNRLLDAKLPVLRTATSHGERNGTRTTNADATERITAKEYGKYSNVSSEERGNGTTAKRVSSYYHGGLIDYTRKFRTGPPLENRSAIANTAVGGGLERTRAARVVRARTSFRICRLR